MSEEEIIEIIEDYLQYKECNGNVQAKTIGRIDEAIFYLLDMYKQEKEKDKLSDKEKEIIEAYRKLVKVTGIATGWVICDPATMWSEYFISKDKIKEKIEELEKRYTEHSYFQYNKNEVTDICINELRELLEEV